MKLKSIKFKVKDIGCAISDAKKDTKMNIKETKVKNLGKRMGKFPARYF